MDNEQSSLDIYITGEYAKMDRFFLWAGGLGIAAFIAGLFIASWIEGLPIL